MAGSSDSVLRWCCTCILKIISDRCSGSGHRLPPAMDHWHQHQSLHENNNHFTLSLVFTAENHQFLMFLMLLLSILCCCDNETSAFQLVSLVWLRCINSLTIKTPVYCWRCPCWYLSSFVQLTCYCFLCWCTLIIKLESLTTISAISLRYHQHDAVSQTEEWVE